MSERSKQRVILVVGACGLDRLLTVPKYPQGDAKVRTTAYNEIGGGNAANTAAAIGRLTDASFVKTRNIVVKYLGKVGRDSCGQRLLEELNECNVDTTSPLCLQGDHGSTTSFTTIIVSEQEQTRTCLHTPGTCGELCVADCLKTDMDVVFENVVHLHSDARHTAASLYLARQAKKRGIPVSCDCEKDRNSSDLDILLEISDIVFTNSNYLRDYIARLSRQLEEDNGIIPLKPPDVQAPSNIVKSTVTSIVDSLTPSSFLARWYPSLGRQVVVTQGSMGALHFQLTHAQRVNEDWFSALNDVSITECVDGVAYRLKNRFNQLPRNHDTACSFVMETEYFIQLAGILQGVKIVDTTGAGDAFIGGYLLAMLEDDKKITEKTDSCDFRSHDAALAMNFGSWVACKKLEGPGVRKALPMGKDVDDVLGLSVEDVDNRLKSILSSFSTCKS